MPPPSPTTRQALLLAAVDHVTANGLGDLSLRRLATGLGTSHRMLIYHFGSRQGLLVEIIREAEARQRAALADLRLDPGATPLEIARRMWERVADPELWPLERLFFEIYGQALQGQAHAAPLLDGIVDSWLAPLEELSRAFGLAEADVAPHARLMLAVTRGLLLDLLATGDRAAVDAALEQFSALMLAGTPAAAAPTAPAAAP